MSAEEKWISVEERLPEVERDEFLCATFYGFIFVVVFLRGEFLHNEAMGGKVTHWMPLPPAPTSQDRKEDNDGKH